MKCKHANVIPGITNTADRTDCGSTGPRDRDSSRKTWYLVLLTAGSRESLHCSSTEALPAWFNNFLHVYGHAEGLFRLTHVIQIRN